MAKKEIWELRQPLQLSAQTMQQLATEAETQISTVLRTIPVPVGEAAVTKITS